MIELARSSSIEFERLTMGCSICPFLLASVLGRLAACHEMVSSATESFCRKDYKRVWISRRKRTLHRSKDNSDTQVPFEIAIANARKVQKRVVKIRGIEKVMYGVEVA